MTWSISRRFQILALTASAVCAFVSNPASAAPKARNACNVAREYIRLTELQRYDRIGSLWADDAVFYAPDGRTIRGALQIGEFYSGFLKRITPVNRIGSLTFDPKAGRCAMEIETRVVRGSTGAWVPDPKGDFEGTVIDLFTVNGRGKITRMKVYLAPLPKD